MITMLMSNTKTRTAVKSNLTSGRELKLKSPSKGNTSVTTANAVATTTTPGTNIKDIYSRL